LSLEANYLLKETRALDLCHFGKGMQSRVHDHAEILAGKISQSHQQFSGSFGICICPVRVFQSDAKLFYHRAQLVICAKREIGSA
jgi:hypothetical protein